MRRWPASGGGGRPARRSRAIPLGGSATAGPRVASTPDGGRRRVPALLGGTRGASPGPRPSWSTSPPGASRGPRARAGVIYPVGRLPALRPRPRRSVGPPPVRSPAQRAANVPAKSGTRRCPTRPYPRGSPPTGGARTRPSPCCARPRAPRRAPAWMEAGCPRRAGPRGPPRAANRRAGGAAPRATNGQAAR